MRMRAETARRAVIGQARNEIRNAAGNNTLLSRAEQKALPEDLARAADFARQAKGPGARVSVNDVVDSYASYVSSVFGAVNTKGPTWLSKAEQGNIYDDGLRGRVGAFRVQISAMNGEMPVAQRQQMAAQYVIDNANPTLDHGRVDDNSLFPHVDVGEDGLHAHLSSGADAQRIVDFANAFFYSAKPGLNAFDPATHDVLTVRTTFDEESLYVATMDKRTGDITLAGEMGVVDLAYSNMDEAAYLAIMGSFPGGETVFDHIDHYEVIDDLVAGGTPLDIGRDDA